jgi:hypothetical protein
MTLESIPARQMRAVTGYVLSSLVLPPDTTSLLPAAEM